ncbi:2953_t:CDS:2 [Funneliformis mosseae]|uniref:2953_t:CDS:1 n=1 Tax=Funneliformis mosseae TaxID=27381 RepID=A0A9N8ZBT3_FUNMO|nr:2953_t:CDS:2 [Funneliformis mosseae]
MNAVNFMKFGLVPVKTNTIFLNSIVRKYVRPYKTTVSQIKKGEVIEHKNRHYMVTKIDSHFTGRGSAATKFELKDVITGKVIVERLRPSESFEVSTLSDKSYTYLYSDKKKVYLSNHDTFEDIEIDADKIEGGEKYLQLLEDDIKVTVSFLETEEGINPISFRLPQMHAYRVVGSTSIVGNASKGTAMKVIEIRDGIQVQVPEFINVGDKIIITLNDLKYIKRA